VFAKKTDEIVFVKVQNDGFSLGSQRHPVDQNDLPAAQEILQAWQRNERQETPLAQWVDKAAIAESGDYNLTGERYREVIVVNTTWPMVQLEQLCTEMKSGFAFGKYVRDESGIPHLRPMNVTTNGQLSMDDVKRIPRGAEGKFEEFALRKGDVLFNNTNSKELVGKTCYIGVDLGYYFSNHMTRIRTRPDLEPAFLARILHSMWQRGDFLALCNKWVGQAAINNHTLSALHIPLPRLDVQQQIVGELDGYQRIIDGAKQVIANWKPVIPIDPSWRLARLDDVCCLSGQYGSGARKVDYNKEVRYVRITDIDDSGNLKTDGIVSPSVIEPELFLEQGDLLFARSGSVGRVYLHRLAIGKHQFAGYLVRYRADTSKALPEYIFYFTQSPFWGQWIRRQSKTGTLTNINAQQFSSFELPIPPLKVQRQIVADVGKEEQAVESCRNLVSTYEAKIKATIARLWGEEPK
jgi:type I restriction enzyme M protein